MSKTNKQTTEQSTGAINSNTIDFLLSEAGQRAAAQLQASQLSEQNELAHLTSLRSQFGIHQAGALLSLVKLRQRAARKFPAADRLYFIPQALEQATAWEIAIQRAKWIDQHAPAGPILDLGCGIGGDTLALAQYRNVIAYERDHLRLRVAQANAAALNIKNQIDFRHADWLTDLQEKRLPHAAAAYVDPARRVNGRRIFSLHQTQPPLAALLTLQQQIPALCVKCMPSINDTEIPANCDVEFISHEKVCKEAILWFGALRQTASHQTASRQTTTIEKKMSTISAPHNHHTFTSEQTTRVATVYTSDAEWQQIVATDHPPSVGDLQVGQFLHEPDPAVIRAGAFAELCAQLNAHLFDPQIAYLVTTQAGTHPLTQSFELIEIAPFNIKQLNKRLRALDIGQVELKKRGFPIEPEQLRSRLKLTNGNKPRPNQGTIIFTRRGDQRIMLIATRIT